MSPSMRTQGGGKSGVSMLSTHGPQCKHGQHGRQTSSAIHIWVSYCVDRLSKNNETRYPTNTMARLFSKTPLSAERMADRPPPGHFSLFLVNVRRRPHRLSSTSSPVDLLSWQPCLTSPAGTLLPQSTTLLLEISAERHSDLTCNSHIYCL